MCIYVISKISIIVGVEKCMLDIALFTWNCGNQIVSNEDILIIIEKILNIKFNIPEIIIVGIQEARGVRPDKNNSMTVRIKKELNKKLNSIETYEIASIEYLTGMTKLNEPINHQELGIIYKSGRNLEKIVVKNKKVRQSLSGKGGIISTMKVKNIKISLITAHLDSFSAKIREQQIEDLLKNEYEFSNGKGSMGGSDIIFFMGDLNYRLRARVLASLGINPECSFSLANALSHPRMRTYLFVADTLLESNLIYKYKFEFPRPSHNNIFLPTYKRFYRSEELLDTFLPFIDYSCDYKMLKILQMSFFNNQQKLLLNHKRQDEIDLGWLDRIGFLIKTSKVKNIRMNSFEDIAKVKASDHIPILMKNVIEVI